MTTSTQWQLARDAAERYERTLVPAILGPAAQALVDFAAPQASDCVLDVGCGTGAAARFAARRVSPEGRVVGADVNAGMIGVARSLPAVEGAAIEWVEESAYELSFANAEFSLALCAQTLQFLEDPCRALAEIYRVLKPGGRLAVSVWCEIGESPYFDVLVQEITSHLGAGTSEGLRAAFTLRDLEAIRGLVEGAGFRSLRTEVETLALSLPRLPDFIPQHIRATPMAQGFDAASPETRKAIVERVSHRLAEYAIEDGVSIPFRSFLVQAVK